MAIAQKTRWRWRKKADAPSNQRKVKLELGNSAALACDMPADVSSNPLVTIPTVSPTIVVDGDADVGVVVADVFGVADDVVAEVVAADADVADNVGNVPRRIMD